MNKFLTPLCWFPTKREGCFLFFFKKFISVNIQHSSTKNYHRGHHCFPWMRFRTRLSISFSGLRRFLFCFLRYIFGRLMPYHSKLSLYLWYQHLIWIPVHILAIPFLIQLPDDLGRQWRMVWVHGYLYPHGRPAGGSRPENDPVLVIVAIGGVN